MLHSLPKHHRLFILLILCWSDLTAAQSAPPEQKIEITGSSESQRRNETTTRVVVPRAELLRFGDANLTEAVKRLPGVTVEAGDIRLRGLGNGYTRILLNGEPVPQGFSIDTVAPELIDRIEIVRAATVDYGTEAVAGVINIVLRKTVSKANYEAKLGVEDTGAGTGLTPNLSLQATDRNEDFSWSLSGAIRQPKTHESPVTTLSGRDAAGTPTLLRRIGEQDQEKTDIFSLTGRLNWNLAGGDSINWQNFVDIRSNDYAVRLNEQILQGAPSNYPISSGISHSLSKTFRSELGLTRRMTETGKLDLKVGVNHYQRAKDYEYLGSTSEATLLTQRDVHSSQIENSLSISAKYNQLLANDHQLGLGVEVSYIRRSESRLEANAAPDGSILATIDENYDAKVKKLAFYAQDELELTPSWQAYLGVRWDGLFTDSNSNIIVPFHIRSAVWSPVLQTVWKLPHSERDQIRMAFIRTYKAPVTSALIARRYVEYNDNGPTNPSRQGNPRLRPELSWGFDVSYEHYFGKNSIFSTSLWARQINDVTVERLYLENGNWITSPTNTGRAKAGGVEVESRFPLSSWLPAAPPLDIRVNLAWNWSAIDVIQGPYNKLSQQVPLSANLGADYTITPKWSVGGNLHMKRGGSNSVNNNVVKYAGQSRALDLYGVFKVDGKNQLRMAANNLLRQDFHSATTYVDETGSTDRHIVRPGTRTIKLTFEHKF